MKSACKARNIVYDIVSNDIDMNNKLFERGFIFSNDLFIADKHIVLQRWHRTIIGEYVLLVHPDMAYYYSTDSNRTVIIVGHAYNPIEMEHREAIIVEQLKTTGNETDFNSILNKLTGVFTIIDVKNESVRVYGDATGMQSTYYSLYNSMLYISSHSNLIGDVLNLEFDTFIEELADYKFYKLQGHQLPGDYSQFTEVKLLIPNHFVEYKAGKLNISRFYTPHKLQLKDTDIVNRIALLMNNNMKLIAVKWNNSAISLTGGCDSKTTLACANGLYDKFRYFSYGSSNNEYVDAIAAAEICKSIGLQHSVIDISQNNAEFDKYAEIATILKWNTGGIRDINSNDVRKRIVLDNVSLGLEVKSWVSEIGRAYYSKRFNKRTDFGELPEPRTCTTLYKFFLHNRALVRKVDNVFAEYINKYYQKDMKDPIAWQEQFFWECRMPCWGGIVITGEQRYSNDITIPYNNRLILELLLSTSIENRLNDIIYTQIRTKMNPEIDKLGINVTNVNHTKRRARLENLYYLFNNIV